MVGVARMRIPTFAACTTTCIAMTQPSPPAAKVPNPQSHDTILCVPIRASCIVPVSFCLMATTNLILHCPIPSSIVSLLLPYWTRLDIGDHENVAVSLSSPSLHSLSSSRHTGRVWGNRAHPEESRSAYARPSECHRVLGPVNSNSPAGDPDDDHRWSGVG